MYSERLKAMDKGGGSVMAFAAALVVLLVIMVGISNFLHNRFGIPYLNYVVFLLFIVVAIYVYRKRILEYQYRLDKGMLIFEEIVGKRCKEIITVDLQKAMYFVPLSMEGKCKVRVDKNLYFLFNKKSDHACVLVAKLEGVVYRIVFQPGERLAALIDESLCI